MNHHIFPFVQLSSLKRSTIDTDMSLFCHHPTPPTLETEGSPTPRTNHPGVFTANHAHGSIHFRIRHRQNYSLIILDILTTNNERNDKLSDLQLNKIRHWLRYKIYLNDETKGEIEREWSFWWLGNVNRWGCSRRKCNIRRPRGECAVDPS